MNRRYITLVSSLLLCCALPLRAQSVIGFEELTRRGQLIIARTYGSFEIWSAVAIIYLIMTLSISQLVGYLERRYKIK